MLKHSGLLTSVRSKISNLTAYFYLCMFHAYSSPKMKMKTWVQQTGTILNEDVCFEQLCRFGYCIDIVQC